MYTSVCVNAVMVEVYVSMAWHQGCLVVKSKCALHRDAALRQLMADEPVLAGCFVDFPCPFLPLFSRNWLKHSGHFSQSLLSTWLNHLSLIFLIGIPPASSHNSFPSCTLSFISWSRNSWTLLSQWLNEHMDLWLGWGYQMLILEDSYRHLMRLWNSDRHLRWSLLNPAAFYSWRLHGFVDRIEWRRAWSYLIQSATIVGSSTPLWFSSLTRKTCLPTKSAHHR